MSANQELLGATGAGPDYIDNPTTNTYVRIAPAKVTYDAARNEVRITSSLKDFTERITPGRTVVSKIGANTAGCTA